MITGGWGGGANAPEFCVVGPRSVLIVSDVDLTGDDVESILAVRLRTLEATIRESPAVAGAVLSLSAPDELSLTI
jgi:hypothetical protein